VIWNRQTVLRDPTTLLLADPEIVVGTCSTNAAAVIARASASCVAGVDPGDDAPVANLARASLRSPAGSRLIASA